MPSNKYQGKDFNNKNLVGSDRPKKVSNIYTEIPDYDPLLKFDLINNLLLLFDLELIDLYNLFDKSDSDPKQQALIVKKLKEIDQIIADLSRKSKAELKVIV